MKAGIKFSIARYGLVVVAYTIALSAGLVFILFSNSQQTALWKAFYADIIATLVIFIFSVSFRNSSFYDSYWSVAPFVIAFYWFCSNQGDFSFRVDLIMIALLIWGMRLTYNWAAGWKGLKQEDWRYLDLRLRMGKFFQLVNLTGIHLFPTLMVFLCMLPVYFAAHVPLNSVWFLDYLAFIFCLGATLIEWLADEQQRSFKTRREHANDFCQQGLWKFSRHPNYFGEILFWWSIYFFVIAANDQYWWTIMGPVALTAMFFFISIPMMEARLLTKNPAYARYRSFVSALIPWN